MEKYKGMELWQVVNENIDKPIDDSALGIWQRACEYFMWCDSNPVTWKTAIMSGTKAGSSAINESPHPYSVKAICVYCGMSEAYISHIRNSKETGSDYYLVISKILNIIYVQNLNYAVTGVYSSTFTSKLLNVGEDTSVPEPVKVEVITKDIPRLSSTENEVLEKLETEKSFKDLEKEAKQSLKNHKEQS